MNSSLGWERNTPFQKMGLNLDKYLAEKYVNECHTDQVEIWLRICFQNSIKARRRVLPEYIWIHKYG